MSCGSGYVIALANAGSEFLLFRFLIPDSDTRLCLRFLTDTCSAGGGRSCRRNNASVRHTSDLRASLVRVTGGKFRLRSRRVWRCDLRTYRRRLDFLVHIFHDRKRRLRPGQPDGSIGVGRRTKAQFGWWSVNTAATNTDVSRIQRSSSKSWRQVWQRFCMSLVDVVARSRLHAVHMSRAAVKLAASDLRQWKGGVQVDVRAADEKRTGNVLRRYA